MSCINQPIAAAVLLSALALGMPSCSAPDRDDAASRLAYPSTRKIEQVDDYHGTAVADPYRWL